MGFDSRINNSSSQDSFNQSTHNKALEEAVYQERLRSEAAHKERQRADAAQRAAYMQQQQSHYGGSGSGGGGGGGGFQGGPNHGHFSMMSEHTSGRIVSPQGSIDVTIRTQVGTKGWVHSEELNGRQTGHITGHPDGGIHRHGSLWDGSNGKTKGWDKTNGKPPAGGILSGFFKR